MTGDFPDWTAFTPEFAAAELPRLFDEAETAVAAIEAARPSTYEDFVWRLDDATRELWRTWGRVGHLVGVMNSEAWRKVQDDFQAKMVQFGLRVGQSKALYEIGKSLLDGTALGDECGACGAHALPTGDDNRGAETVPTRRRIVEKMIQSAEEAGVGLAGEQKARFNEIAARLARLGNDFYNAVIDATAAFKYEKDGKVYTIDDANYPETMRQCADREVRERLYRARVVRAPGNEARIDEILRLRDEQAKILGFANFAEQSLAVKCAPSVGAVYDMIAKLDEATGGKAAEDEAELRRSWSAPEVASPVGAGQLNEEAASRSLQPWDRAYEAERLRERKYAYSEEDLKRHFEFADVLKGLFRLTKFLFDVDVEEVCGAAKPSVWHPDVRFFAVKEGGETIAHFYLDPYVRSGQKAGGAWMNEFRNRSVRSDLEVASPVGAGQTGTRRPRRAVTPLAVLVLNLPLPDEHGKCLMPFREVETLFHEFGHALQCMLTRIDEEDAAGINLVEWDAVEVASQFMENWCLDDRTGIVVPAELKAKVRAAKNFRAATACRRQLAFAKLDLDLHSNAAGCGRRQSPNEVKDEVFARFGLPMIPEDRFLNAFTHVFAGGYAAGYYGYKWAEVMSADCYGAFEEAGLADDAAVRRIGARYRETILALGGSQSALEVFRAFRGRDPEIDAPLRQQDLS